MWYSSWLPNRIAKRPAERRPSNRPRTQCRPRLEVLEGRDVPSTLTVTNTLDYGPGSLRYEIAQAQSNDTIVFNFGSKKANNTPHTITLFGGELDISKSLTIKGQGETIASEPYVTGILGFADGSRIFEVDAGATVAISGLTLTGGGGTRDSYGVTGNLYDGYGGAILNFGNLTITGCTLGGSTPVYYGNAGDTGLRGNTAAIAGGAIANFGTMTVSGCNVSNNSAFGDAFKRGGGGGGGIYNAGTMTVSGSHVVDNSAGTGGGIENAGTAAALTVSSSTFSGNSPDAIFGSYIDGGGNSFS